MRSIKAGAAVMGNTLVSRIGLSGWGIGLVGVGSLLLWHEAVYVGFPVLESSLCIGQCVMTNDGE